MRSRFLVIGLGQFGAALAESLTHRGSEVIAVDRDMDNVEAVKDRVAYAMELDATDPEALRSIDAAQCTGAIVTMGDDFEACVLSVAALKEVGVPTIIARARTDRQGRILEAVGASRVVEIEIEMGRALGSELVDDVRAAAGLFRRKEGSE